MEYYAELKEKNILMCYNTKNLKDTVLSEISQSQKDKHCIISTHMKKSKSETYNRKLIAKGVWELVYSGYRVSVLKDENVLEICCTIM